MSTANHLDNIVSALTKQFGKGAAHKLTDAPESSVSISGWTSTGCPAIDSDVIGRPGIPDGRVCTILGAASSAKSTLVQHLMIEHQKRGGIPFLIPAEPFERERAIQLGMDPDKVVILDASTVEDNFALIDAIVDNSPGGEIPTMICWDSFSASPTKAELDAEPGFEGKAMAEHSRLVSQQMRKLQGKMETKNVTLVVVLQSKQKVGVTFGSPVTYLAERPWHFYSYVQLEMKYKGHVKQGEKDIGIKVEVKCRKNKVGPPFKTTDVECLFESGIDATGAYLEAAVRYNLIGVRGGGRFFLPLSDGTERKFTRRAWPEVLRDFPSLVAMIKERQAQFGGKPDASTFTEED